MKKLRLSIVFCLALIQHSLAQLPVAEFSANQVSGCAPLSVTFRDQSTGDPKFWSWDFGNGQFSNLQNPSIAYSAPGTYTVNLVVRNDDGTHGITKTDYITVNPSPVASFSANITTGCIPSNIQFTDLSSPMAGTITNWEWDFGDGTTSTAQNPLKTYNTVGFFTVSLRVTSSTGCQAVRSVGRYIRIVSGVTADFDFTPPATCRPPYITGFTNLTSGPGDLTYQWDFGNSTNSTQVNPTTTYAAAGTFTVTLTARSEFGCTGTIQKPVAINGIVTNFNAPDTACLNTAVNFINASSATPLSSQWSFGNGEQSDQLDGNSTYPTPGNYTVKLINVYSGCTDSVSKPLVISPRPTVDFTAPNVIACKAPLTVNFQDLSPDATSWVWNFGDGATSTQQNPSHQYTTEGEFTVSLAITSRRGCVNAVTKPAYVRIVKPIVGFANAPTGGCVPFNFTAVPDVVAIDGVASYAWDFGNGVTRTGVAPGVVTYPTPGSYTLTLTVTTNGGCTETLVMPNGVRTGTPPVVNFSTSLLDACSGAGVLFTDLSTPPPSSPGGVDQWLWDFGDGQTATNQNPIYRFADTGMHTITLTSFANRCPGTPVARTIHVSPPVAAFTTTVDCSNQSMVTITNESIVNPVYGPISYSWDFGDPSIPPSTQANPALVTYPSLGDYAISLTVTNGACSQTIIKNIKLVGELANFTVSPLTVCKDSSIRITSTNPAANVSLYVWTMEGSPAFIGQQSIIHRFANTGSYDMSLRITDINGCQSVKSIPNAVTVTGPIAGFSTAAGTCKDKSVTFNDLSTGTGLREWTFDFGDGQTQTFTSPPFTHIYSDTGKFVVRLTVKDNGGCADTYQLPDTVWITNPIPGFTTNYTTICPRTDIQFTDTSQGNSLTYNWDFGDGTTSTDQNPVHQYTATTGSFTVKLVVQDASGCIDSVVRNNHITVTKPRPAFDIKDTTSICPPLETKFTFAGQDYESFFWDFGDGSTSSLANPTHFYNDYGRYTAKLYLVGYGGCLDSISDSVTVYNPYTNTDIVYNAPTTCDSLRVDFAITTPPSTTFTFYFADGQSDNTQAKQLNHLYKIPGYYGPYLVLKDNQDCQVTIGGPGTAVIVTGAPVLFGMDKNKFCDAGRVYFTDYTRKRYDDLLTFVWDFDDGTTSSVKDPTHDFGQPGTYAVKLTWSTSGGCNSFMTDTVRVYNTPSPVIVSDNVVCINDVLALEGALMVPDTAITWKWDLAGGGSSVNNPNTSATYGKDGNYTIRLEATNKLGCKSNTTKNILVPPTPVINVERDPAISVGSGINLPVTYGPEVVNYAWTPPSNLSCTDCPTPYANPKFTTKYNVRVEDMYGCSSNQDITVTVVCNDKNYFVPNTFSPNGDGHNDIFYPRGSSITRISHMRIFNRWGELIFEKRNFSANDASAGWNGTYKGKPANQDVYIYLVEFICENASIVPFRGDVMLVR